MIKSVNHMVVCEPYKGSKGLKSKISGGVSIIQQKTSVIGLRVLADAYISEQLTLKAGSIAYLREDILCQFQDYSTPFNSDATEEPFVLVNYSHIAFIKEGK